MRVKRAIISPIRFNENHDELDVVLVVVSDVDDDTTGTTAFS